MIEAPAYPNLPIIESFSGEKAEFGQFTKRQREWILRRDMENGIVRCRFVDKHGNECPINENNYGGRSKFHIHHILPQGFWEQNFGLRQLGEEAEDPNQPWNGITLCGKNHHNGLNGIHPDYARALKEYYKDPFSFAKVADLHHQKSVAGEVYWVDTWDKILSDIALQRTEEYQTLHPEDIWPSTPSFIKKKARLL